MPSRIVPTLALCLAGAMVLVAQTRHPSAWESLVRANPDIVEDQSLSWRDRLVMNVLTPDQADLYFNGRVGAEDLRLEDGRTLAQYLEAKLTPPAQVFIPLAGPCRVSPLADAGGEPGVSLVQFRSSKGDGRTGEEFGCSIPATATAALLKVLVRAEGGGETGVKLWAADMPEPAATDGGEPLTWPAVYETTLLAPLCERECFDGDTLLRTGGAEVTAQVLGYFRPLVATDGGGGVLLSTESSDNNFFGTGAGANVSSGAQNSFFGANAGNATTTSSSNSYFGYHSGAVSTGASNSFFGASAGTANTTASANSFFGASAGAANTTGDSNSFFGASAGAANTTGSFNSFFGWNAGASNSGISNTFVGAGAGQNNTGNANAFFGRDAGMSNSTGSDNICFGRSACILNTTGSANSIVGSNAGFANTTGGDNTFLGRSAGFNNTTGSGNAFFGRSAGLSNTTESNNTYFGGFSNGLAGITNATAMGFRSQVSQSNSLILGSINGVNGATANVNVGIGTDAPQAALHLTRSDGTARLRVQEASSTTASRVLLEILNNGGAFFNLRNTNVPATWSFSVSAVGAFQIDNPSLGAGAEMVFFNNGNVRMGPGGTQRFLLDSAGNLTITGDLTANGMMYPSDRALKENVVPVDSAALLKNLSELPIGFWNYRADPSATRHVGPMAQDFLEKFAVGSDDRRINAMDAAGITLAAVQGLYEILQKQSRELESQRDEIRLLKEELQRLRKP